MTTSTSSENRVTFAGGTGTVDLATGAAEVRWSGSVTSAFYGGLVYWSATDPVLTVQPGGTGTLTATLTGHGASMADPTVWTALPATSVTLANLSHVELSTSGFAADPDYPATWPQSFVDFQRLTGESSYWYDSGSHDDLKVPAPLNVLYTAAVDPSATTSPTPAATTAAPTSAAPATSTPATAAATTPAATASPACTLAHGITGASLTWGFKKSFRAYVSEGPAANAITASGGATILTQDLAVATKPTSGAYSWPYESSSGYTSPSAFTVTFGGSVEFSYPAHYFDLTIANPVVTVDGTAGTLVADVTLTSNQPGTAATTTKHPGTTLATLDTTKGTLTSTSTALTRNVAVAIQDVTAFTLNGSTFYQKGDRLDDASVSLAGCSAAVATAGPTSLAATGGGAATTGTTVPSAGASAVAADLVPATRFRPATAAGSLAFTGDDAVPLTAAALVFIVGGGVLAAGARSRTGAVR